MKIAYLCTDFGIPVCGTKGAAIHVRSLSQALQDLGHSVAILTPRTGGPPPSDFTVPLHEFPLAAPEQHYYQLLRRDADAGESIAREVRAALYSTTFRHETLGLLREFAPDLLYERYALGSTAGLSLAADLGVPLLLEVNAPLADEQAAHRGLAFCQTARALEQQILRTASQVIVVSAELRRWAVANGVAADQVTILPNATDPATFVTAPAEREQLRATLGLGDQPTIGFVGTLKGWHGTANLLRATALLHQQGLTPQLLIIGDGPERSRLEALARREGIADATIFTGSLPHEAIPAHLAVLDIAVAPYDQTENFYFSPLKVFEYLAAARPVVAADIGQIRECITHDVTGYLYPPGDVAALADALATLLTNPTRAAALGRAGQAFVCAHHTWAGNARMVVALGQTLLGNHQRQR